MGEYEDPFTNYSRTMMRLGQTVEQGNYEKEIADLKKERDEAKGDNKKLNLQINDMIDRLRDAEF